ncbi:MAG: cytochrome P460 family protein [Candidatus Solibacter usitatus]|nr:cytochrome P460 family protein [Candidatus Solibacter usitatus]
MRLVRIAMILLPAVLCSEEAGMPQPKYTGNGRLVRPTNHREWMFVGASLGMGYSEGSTPNPKATYHNIYIQREAYKAYAATGKFPEKTMLVMEVLAPGTKESINQTG